MKILKEILEAENNRYTDFFTFYSQFVKELQPFVKRTSLTNELVWFIEYLVFLSSVFDFLSVAQDYKSLRDIFEQLGPNGLISVSNWPCYKKKMNFKLENEEFLWLQQLFPEASRWEPLIEGNDLFSVFLNFTIQLPQDPVPTADLLSEIHFHNSSKSEEGTVYTPMVIARSVVGVALKVFQENKRDLGSLYTLDPCAGTGTFILAFLLELQSFNDSLTSKDLLNFFPSIYAIDINERSLLVAKRRLHCFLLSQGLSIKDCRQLKLNFYAGDTIQLLPAQKNRKIESYFLNHSTIDEQPPIPSNFDLIIGNPPYVRQESILLEYKHEILQKYFETYHGRADLYVYFITKAVSLLSPSGIFSFIISDRFFQTAYARKTRKLLLKKGEVLGIIQFGELSIFPSVSINTAIVVYQRKGNVSNKPVEIYQLREGSAITSERWLMRRLPAQWKYFKLPYECFQAEYWSIERYEYLQLKDSISKKSSISLGEICEVVMGIRSGCNRAFVVSNELKNTLEPEIIFQIVEGKNIAPYVIKTLKKWIIYPNKVEIDKYPKILKHLSTYKDVLGNRAQFRQRTDMQWYEIEQPVCKEVFCQPKIIYPDFSAHAFVYDENNYFILDTVFLLILKPSDRFYSINNRTILKYLTAVLNSSIIEFFLKLETPFFRNNRYRYKKQYLEKIPLVFPDDLSICERISFLVDQTQEQSDDFAKNDLINQLNKEIFQIYQLTSEEIILLRDFLNSRKLS